MDESRSPPASRHRWSVRLTLSALGMALIAGWVLWHTVTMSSINEVQHRVDSMKPIVTGIRLTLIALVVIAWPILISRVRRWRRLGREQVAGLDKLRWRIVMWLIVIELVLGQNLLGQMFTLMQVNRA